MLGLAGSADGRYTRSVNDLLTNAERESMVTSVMGVVTVCDLCRAAPVVYDSLYCHRCHAKLREPTTAVPGSPQKQDLLMHRVASGAPLFVLGDLLGDDLIAGDMTGGAFLGVTDVE